MIACSDSGVEPQFEPAILITRIEPEYPRLAHDARVEGEVGVRFTITIAGSTENIEVTDSSGIKAGFEESSISAVSQWEYIPAKLNGQPVQSTDSAVLVFELTL